MDMLFNQPEWWYQSLLDGKHALDFLNSTIENDANLVSGLRLRRFNFTETNRNFAPLEVDPSIYAIYGVTEQFCEDCFEALRSTQNFPEEECSICKEIE